MTEDFSARLSRYAEVAVRIGLNVQTGQRLTVLAPIEATAFVRRVAARAYDAGVRLVDVLWGDETLKRVRFEHAPRDSFAEFPEWRADALLGSVRRGDAILAVAAGDPDLLAGQDPDLIAVAQQTEHVRMKPFMDELMRERTNWSVVAHPVPAWAAAVFPDDPEADRVDRLWDAVLSVCRVSEPNPVASWRGHVRDLRERATWLDRQHFAELRYCGPGTDLRVGLPDGHRWRGGEETTAAGVPFIANMPTEEVFTVPRRDRVDGEVASTRVLSYAGTLIEGIRLRFAEGRVVEAAADRGAEVLQGLLDTDEGAARLGEVALVPESSPVARSGLLFKNTLFDENAACHLALGKAYRACLDGGEDMTDESFVAAGGNDSQVHVDFMVGSPELDIDGVRPDGGIVPVFRGGEWAARG